MVGARDSRRPPGARRGWPWGELVHKTLDRALRLLEAGEGLAKADDERIDSAIDTASEEVARDWEDERAIPPPVIWRHSLGRVRAMSRRGLAFRDGGLDAARAHGEVPFGGAEPQHDAGTPWDPSTPVEIPGTGLRISGYIDRLDISTRGDRALVCDYKTGRAAKKDSIVLEQGKELQRCLYAFAVRALLGDDIRVDASLLYLRDEKDLRLENEPLGTALEGSGGLSPPCSGKPRLRCRSPRSGRRREP